MNADELILRDRPRALKTPACGCIKIMSADLAAVNIELRLEPNSGAPVLFTRILNRDRPPPPRIVPSYCPFCGTAYVPKKH